MIGLIDSDLLDKGTRFPNLALMKISNYYKNKGYKIKLIDDYDKVDNYDKIFLSKVFTKTNIPIDFKNNKNIFYGGTGFNYDKKDFLADEIEHYKPDYNLYNNIDVDGKYYKNHSIGFLTRFCFRQCEFCVNRNKTKVERWSSLEEFDDKKNKYFVFLDDNFLGYKNRVEIFNNIIDTGKPYEFKQGLDFRLINEEIIYLLNNSKSRGNFIFAFDNIEDREIIENKLKLWRKYNNNRLRFYVLTAFDKNKKYDKEFWKNDIKNTFERIRILGENKSLPYIMRYKKYEDSLYRGMYVNLASWCNQPSFFTKMTFRDYSRKKGGILKSGRKGAAWRYLEKFEADNPEIAKEYFDLKFGKYF
ncbi:MAG: hypothetical protein ACQEQF_00055 [Bacillota bacterium]